MNSRKEGIKIKTHKKSIQLFRVLHRQKKNSYQEDEVERYQVIKIENDE